MLEVDLLQCNNGLVTAPAGCGKTHKIVEALERHDGDAPILVLTHTHAGVAALRRRLLKHKVPRRCFVLSTIDGWALHLISTFPKRSGFGGGPHPERPDYVSIRRTACALLRSGSIADVVESSYSRVVVDEYQDCSINQHALVASVARIIPVCVLGDPMQAIFDFGEDRLADWQEHVIATFPSAGELETPWRWLNHGNEQLGQWLLSVRRDLRTGRQIDLSGGPSSARWVELRGDGGDHDRLAVAAACSHKRVGETTLVIGDSRSATSRYAIAKRVPGLVTVEPVDMSDVLEFSMALDVDSPSCVRATLEFAAKSMTNIRPDAVLRRLDAIEAGRNRRPETDLELAALQVRMRPSLHGIAALLNQCSRLPRSRTFRPAVIGACLKAINLSLASPGLTFHEAAVRVREEIRAAGRQLPRHAIGSTLLLKGLEADHVVVLNAHGLDAKNLYVAMTRGAKSVTICSRFATINSIADAI